MKKILCLSLIATMLCVFCAGWAAANDAPVVRVKDIARIQGDRENQLYGLGLVIGLNGSGDGAGAQANLQMVANMLEKFGITVSAADLRLRNVAAVMVTADIASSVRSGDRINVTVSSIGDAKSLEGGFLLQTPLQAANGEIYAAAQGPISIGGFNVRSSGGQKNHATVATIPNGAIVEQEIPQMITDGAHLNLVLAEPDFSTSARLATTINAVYPNSAIALDQSTIAITIPNEYQSNLVGFVASLEELPIQPDTKARVIINERTGTIVIGADVRISTVAVAHNNLNVKVDPAPVIDQVLNLDGSTSGNQVVMLSGSSSVEDLVAALNAIGATPRDIIAILQAIKTAGALFGDLIIM
jgi:flagellar P-ring protein precursor FlgI